MPSAASEFLKARDEVVRAGAGAGKTYALVHKVAEFARAFKAERGRWPRIVATTFTRKATQELRERLLLKALGDAPDLIEFVNSRANLNVATIHGTLDLYLKRHGAGLGIDPGYRVVDEREASRTARLVMRDLLLGPASGDAVGAELLERFTFNRLCRLARRLDAALARAPDARPCRLLDFASIADEAFGRLAGDLAEAKSRIQEETEKADWLAMGDAFGAIADALRGPGPWAARRPRALELAASVKKARWTEKNPAVDERTNELCAAALARARGLDDSIYDPASWAEFAAAFEGFDRLAGRFSIAFRAAKIARGQAEIGDLEALAMDCLRKSPESAEAFAAEWDFWLIDEYQDTAPSQVELLRELTKGAPVYVVGDPQQSIYLFAELVPKSLPPRKPRLRRKAERSGGLRAITGRGRSCWSSSMTFLRTFRGRRACLRGWSPISSRAARSIPLRSSPHSTSRRTRPPIASPARGPMPSGWRWLIERNGALRPARVRKKFASSRGRMAIWRRRLVGSIDSACRRTFMRPLASSTEGKPWMR